MLSRNSIGADAVTWKDPWRSRGLSGVNQWCRELANWRVSPRGVPGFRVGREFLVAALAILFSAALSNSALGQPFVEGDVITYPQGSWGDDPSPTNAAWLLRNNYDIVYVSTSSVFEVGNAAAGGFSIFFTSPFDLLDYLPAVGVPGPLTTILLDPNSTSSGAFGGEVSALKINIDFSDAGVTRGPSGIPFGDLELYNLSTLPFFNGLTVRQFSTQVNTLLGGGSAIYSIAEVNPVARDLNASFVAGLVTPFAQDHLRVVEPSVYSWDGNGAVPPTGSFSVANNWNPNTVPGDADRALFARGSGITYTTTFRGRQGALESPDYPIDQLRVGSNTVTFADDLNFGTLTPKNLTVNNPATNQLSRAILIGDVAGDVAVLNTTLKSFSGVAATIGNAVGSSGTLNVNAGTVSLTGGVINYVNYVGFEGTGALNINSNAAVIVNGDVYLGDAPTANGTLKVSGPGASLTGHALVVARNGTAALTIQNGGAVSNTEARLADSNGANGTATIEGASSTWNIGGSLTVGYFGTATATIQAGGKVSSSVGLIGRESESSGTVTVTGAGSTWNNSGAMTVGGLGSGTLIVTNGGAVSVSGLLSVGSQGTVKGNGNIAGNINNAGIVAPGTSAGALHVEGHYTQAVAGKLHIELGGTTAGTNYDQLLVAGTVSLNGTLLVSLVHPFMPVAGNSFDIIDGSGSPSGAFSALLLPRLSAGLMWNASQLYTAGILRVVIAGDYNGNGVVDAADYVVWRNTLGQSNSGLAADGDGSNQIDSGDYNVWRSHFGQAVPSGATAGLPSSATVPEPSTMFLFMAGCVFWRPRCRGAAGL